MLFPRRYLQIPFCVSPEVQDEQVGLMGVSWGGIISSIVLGIDQRFAFTIPVYGCGYLNEADNQYKRNLVDNNAYLNGWEAGTIDWIRPPCQYSGFPGLETNIFPWKF